MTLLRSLLVIAAGSLMTARAATVDWSSFTGGGGISQHGGVAIGGAIGAIAPAPWQAEGGGNVLAGGFWSGLPGQPLAASPILKIASLGGQKVLLSWPMALPGFVLEYAIDPASGVWVIESTEVVDTATDHTVTVAPENPFRCYRLRAQ